MNRLFKILLFALAVSVTAAACGEKGHEEHEAADNVTYTCPMHPQIVQETPGDCPICGMDLVPVKLNGEATGELMLSESQIALANIETMEVAKGAGGASTILTGKLVLDETQTEVISSRATGRVERLYIKETGERVRKGQPLYEMYSEELLTLQREFLLALEQHRQLGEQQPRYASFLEAARQKLLLYGLSEGQIRQLASSGNMEASVTFLAPTAGVVTDIAATEGQYIPEGGVLYRLADLRNIWVEAELYPQEIETVDVGDEVQVAVQGFAPQPTPATVTFISPELRQGSQVVLLRAALPNENGAYLPGMQANVLLPQQRQQPVAMIPTSAVIQEQQGSHVWVQTGEGTFTARQVVTGDAAFDSVAIISGLAEGERVVASGAYLLYSEYVLKKGGNPVKDAAVALATNTPAVQQTPTEVYLAEEAVAFATEVPAAVKEQLEKSIEAYLGMKNALVIGDTDAAAKAAMVLLKVLDQVPDAALTGEAAAFWQEKRTFLLRHVKLSLEAASLEAKRENFVHLSQPYIKLIEAFDLSVDLYVQYCPMANNDKGAFWLSAEPEIRNPFYGEAMLTCGEVVKEL